MSLQGSATATELRGKINSLDVLCVDAYAIAVKNGFDGTEKEWLASLKGEKGDKPVKGVDYFTAADKAELIAEIEGTSAFISYIDLPSANWEGDEGLFHQVVTIDGVNEYSKVDINPSVQQMAILHKKDIAFVTENEDGVVTVYCIGQKPVENYTMQVTITGVFTNG